MQGTDGEVSPVLVNIGCGPTWHPAWTNLDIRPPNGQVQAWDVSKGLPFGENKVDVCYASHVLEHLSRDQARALLHRITSYNVCYTKLLRRSDIPELSLQDRGRQGE